VAIHRKLRRPGVLLLVVVLLALSATAAADNEPEDTKAKLEAILSQLEKVNEVIDYAIEVSESSDWGDFWYELRKAKVELGDAISLLPDVYGIPFYSWFMGFYNVRTSLEMVDERRNLPDAVQGAVRAKSFKEDLEELVGERLEAVLNPCQEGTTLVVVYPGFCPDELRSTVEDLLVQGKCVTVSWRVSEAYSLGLGFDANRAMQTLVFTALSESTLGDPGFKIDGAADPSSSEFSDIVTIGDSASMPRKRTEPAAAHTQYDASTLASGTSQGQPIGLGESPTLTSGDPVGTWFRITNVCGPIDVAIAVYNSIGQVVDSFTRHSDPSDAGVDCYSSSSSLEHFSVSNPGYWLGRTYWVELWVDDVHSATHPFKVVPPQQSPIVQDDRYTAGVGEAIEGNVLRNDFDLNDDPLTTELVTAPRHGALTLNPDGSFVYVPDAEFTGYDEFVHAVTDGQSAPASSTTQLWIVGP
jgi:hypothetical protein